MSAQVSAKPSVGDLMVGSSRARRAAVKLQSAVKRHDWFSPLVILLACPLLFMLPITHDAIWQIWLGRQMLHGARLYTDLIEVNPPLWFWIAVPLAALGLTARVTVICFFIAAIGLSLYLAPRRFRLASFLVIILVPLEGFGQREHFTLIATVPYAFAIAARSQGKTPRHPVLIGIFAGIGVCLKPYFILAPILLELLVWRRRRLRGETVSLAAFILAYGAAIPLFAPAYLTDTIPLVRRFYGAFGQHPDSSLLVLTIVFAAAGAILSRRKGSPEARALIVASVAFVPAVLIQAKGFPYHSIPVRGFLCLAIITELMQLRRNPVGDGLLVCAAALCCLPLGVYRNSFRGDMEAHLRDVPCGASIIVLASNPSTAWPMVEEHGLRWQLHEFSVWQVAAVVRDPSLKPEVQRIVAQDLAKRPDVLILDRRPIVGPAAQALVPPNYLDAYSLKLRTGNFVSYIRKGPVLKNRCYDGR